MRRVDRFLPVSFHRSNLAVCRVVHCSHHSGEYTLCSTQCVRSLFYSAARPRSVHRTISRRTRAIGQESIWPAVRGESEQSPCGEIWPGSSRPEQRCRIEWPAKKLPSFWNQKFPKHLLRSPEQSLGEQPRLPIGEVAILRAKHQVERFSSFERWIPLKIIWQFHPILNFNKLCVRPNG